MNAPTMTYDHATQTWLWDINLSHLTLEQLDMLAERIDDERDQRAIENEADLWVAE